MNFLPIAASDARPASSAAVDRPLRTVVSFSSSPAVSMIERGSERKTLSMSISANLTAPMVVTH